MGSWANKTFHRSRCVKVGIYYADRHVRTYFVVPKDDVFTINQAAYFIKPEAAFIDSQKFTCFAYSWDNPDPIMPTINKPLLSTAQDFDASRNTLIFRQVFEAIKGKTDTISLNMLLSLVTIGGVGAMIYLLISRLDALQTTVNEILRLLQLLGGM